MYKLKQIYEKQRELQPNSNNWNFGVCASTAFREKLIKKLDRVNYMTFLFGIIVGIHHVFIYHELIDFTVMGGVYECRQQIITHYLISWIGAI